MSREKLEEFFQNIQDRSITVQHNFGKSTQEGFNHIDDYKKYYSDMGFLFYHIGDKMIAMETGTLYLSWGSYSGNDIDTLTVANAILDEGTSCGLQIKWNGAITDKIVIFEVDKDYFT